MCAYVCVCLCVIQQRGNGRAVHSLTSTWVLNTVRQKNFTIGFTTWLSNYRVIILVMILAGFGRAVLY